MKYDTFEWRRNRHFPTLINFQISSYSLLLQQSIACKGRYLVPDKNSHKYSKTVIGANLSSAHTKEWGRPNFLKIKVVWGNKFEGKCLIFSAYNVSLPRNFIHVKMKFYTIIILYYNIKIKRYCQNNENEVCKE